MDFLILPLYPELENVLVLKTFWGAVAGAVIGLVGSMMSNKSNQDSADDAMAQQDEWRADQYQTSMADMREAGLNPILAYKQGGAGTPSGVSANYQNSGAAAVEGFKNSSNTAQTVKMNKKVVESIDKTMEKQDDEISQIHRTQENTVAQTKVAEMQQLKTYQEYLTERENTNSAKMQNAVSQAYLRSQTNKGSIKSGSPNLQKFDVIMDTLGKLLGGGNSAKSLIK